jgi:hypothetical protein
MTRFDAHSPEPNLKAGRERIAGARLSVRRALALLSVTLLAGAGDPAVVAVRVPARDVSKYFPAGTELRVMPAGKFESLVARATAGMARQQAAQPPRLIRARHHASFRSGVLAGRSEFVIEAARTGPADFVLEPWTPAVRSTSQTANVLGARDSGKASLWIEQSPNQTSVIDWELQPRSIVAGRSFTLGLPGNETTVLALELPRNWVPSCRRGRRRGPLSSATSALESLWEIEPDAGQIDVHIYDPGPGASLLETGTWLSGSTQIDLRRNADRAGGLVNWKTEWRLELDPRNPRPLEIELDPGLELIDVQGPAVRGYQSERASALERLVVTIDAGKNTSTELTLLAHARVPSEGEWSIPSLRPTNATWTGGTTTVVLDEFHVLKECREKAGRRVFPVGRDSGQPDRLEFESSSPRSVAELVFRRPRPDVPCEVRGRLFVAGSPARLECELNWGAHDGSISDLEIDLSPTWLVDQVMIRGKDDPLAWHPSLLPTGNTRLHVALPAGTNIPKELVVTVRASSTVSGARGPLQLPRVRPVGAPVLDETWVAWVDQGTMIQPTLARGLAWIDPNLVPGLLTPRSQGQELREALAWRWIAEDALARVDREPVEQESAARVRVHARIDSARRRLVVDGRLMVYAGAGPLDAVPLWMGHGDNSLESWRFSDLAGTPLATRPIDGPAREQLGFPKEGMARNLVVDIPYQTEKSIEFHAEYPWQGHTLIPLLAPSRDFLSRGIVMVETPGRLQSRVQTAGLRRVLASALDQAPSGPDHDITPLNRDGREPAKAGTIEAFAYSEPGSRLEVFTEPLAATETAGIIREALLTTSIDPNGTLLYRLRLLVNVVEAGSLDFSMPPGLSLVRVRGDGVDLTPIKAPAGLSIPLTGSGQGSKSSTVVIDYVADRRMLADGDRLRPELPRFALPCLSFEWEVITSAAWRATDPGLGLVSIDRTERFDWPYAAVGLPAPAWSSLRIRGGRQDEDVLRPLDDRLADPVAAELTFAEWFSRWDSGRWPVVIDRIAFQSAGLGPKSQFVPAIVTAGSRNVALANLKRHGLALVPFENAFVITTAAELPRLAPVDRWAESFTEALVWGSDRTDRFQSLARWRGEPSPRLSSAIGEEAAVGIRPPPGWSTWSYSGTGWPQEDAFVYLINVRTRIITGWMVAALCLLAWVWCRGWLGRSRLFALTAVMALCVLVEWLVPSRYAFSGAAIYLSAFVVLLIEIGRDLRRPQAPYRAVRRTESSLVRRAANAAVSLLLVGLSVAKIDPAAAAVVADGGSAILALFPYEGPADPSRPARDVILRLADFNRLSLLADSNVPRAASLVRAKSALHRVTRKTDFEVVVDSEIDLIANGRAPFAWSFPVSSAHDIEVTLDGKRLPVAIEPGGARGRVEIAEAGEHRLHIRRSAATVAEDGLAGISLPVGAMPSARVVVEPGADGRQDGDLIARGATELEPDHSLIGLLGPADRIEVHWKRPTGAAATQTKGTLDGLILWDITPAGERVRARLTCRQVPGHRAIRLARQDGLILRSARASGSAEIFCEENASKGEWIIHVDPRLQDGSTIELDCWLPSRAANGDGAGKSQAVVMTPVGSTRAMPRLQPVGVEKYSGALGVRRPGEWTGRFDPLPDTEPISDESFVEFWGSLPQEALTLCGTSRFVHECRAILQTGPVPAKVQVKPTILVQIESGRVALTVEAEITELAGHLGHIQAEVPENIQIIEVTADGLSDWTVSADRRLHLMFDRPVSRPKRALRVLALIPLREEPLQMSARQHQLKMPWFGWEGVEASAGFLTISSIAKPELRVSTGLTLISSESARAGVTATPRHRATYRVDDPRKLGEMVWESIPARVSVAIESQMTIHPDSAEWVAVLRYDVIGGALDAIRLRMPAAWAANAEIRLSGSEYQLTRETSGPFTFWSIIPERPIWGSQRFVLRATRTLEPDREIDFPEISPLGQGAIDAYLGVVDATDRSLTATNAVGLQPIPFATRFRAGEFATRAGRALAAFRVSQKSWALRVQSPRIASPIGASQPPSVRLSLADLTAVVMPDRSFLGRAVYDTVAGTGGGISFVLPADSLLLWATVDFNPVVPLRNAGGVWSIACDERRPCRIGLIWRTNPSPASMKGSRSFVPLPRAGVGTTSTLVTVYTPAGVVLSQGDYAELVPAGMARLEMARADWLAGSVNELVAKFDRSSGRDHEKLVSLLINHEMALRSAQRSVQWTEPRGTSAESGGALHDINLIRSARVARDEAIGRAGLDNDLVAARIYLGDMLANLSQPPAGVAEPSAPERIRLLGRPFSLIGSIPGIDGPSSTLSLTLQRQSLAAIVTGPRDLPIVTILLILGLSLVTVLPARFTGQSALGLMTALGLAGYTGGPLILAGAFGLAAAAWTRARV